MCRKTEKETEQNTATKKKENNLLTSTYEMKNNVPCFYLVLVPPNQD